MQTQHELHGVNTMMAHDQSSDDPLGALGDHDATGGELPSHYYVNGTLIKPSSEAINTFLLGADAKHKLVTDDVVTKLLDTNVKYIDVCECEFISDKMMEEIAGSCPLLESLNVKWCLGITDEGLLAIGNGCRELKSLDIAGCKEVTDKGLEAIGQGCKKLKSLVVRGCDKITNEGLRAIRQECQELESLTVAFP